MPVLRVWAADLSAQAILLLEELGFVALVVAVGLVVLWLLPRIELGREIPDHGKHQTSRNEVPR